MSVVHLCDGRDHALAEGDCSHVFAVARMTPLNAADIPGTPKELCRACLEKHLKAAYDAKSSYRVDPIEKRSS